MEKYKHEFVLGFSAIANEIGLSTSTLKRRVRTKRVTLAKWGRGATSPRYCSRLVLDHLRALANPPKAS